MIIVADGGSTKVDWILIQNNALYKKIQTKGANPFFRPKDEIADDIRINIYPETTGVAVEHVHFFGAGCANAEKCDFIRLAISSSLNISPEIIEIGSDLLGTAKALCKNEPGIACILGTGSNSGYYDGNQIVENVSPLGYILGDEGSGAVLGKLFIGACFKNQVESEIKKAFLDEYKLTPNDVIENVYRRNLPNRYLAGFTPFLKNNLDNPYIYNLVATSFEDFFRRNAMQYDNYQNLPIHFSGSVAYHFRNVLTDVAEKLGIKIQNIASSPVKGLVEYYCGKENE